MLLNFNNSQLPRNIFTTQSHNTIIFPSFRKTTEIEMIRQLDYEEASYVDYNQNRSRLQISSQVSERNKHKILNMK